MGSRDGSDMKDYCELWRENLIEGITLIVSQCLGAGMFTVGTKAAIGTHLVNLGEFVFESCQEKENPTIDYLRDCTNLLMDYCQMDETFMWAREIFDDPRFSGVYGIIQKLKMHQKYDRVDETLQYATRIGSFVNPGFQGYFNC
jgi:hypothetical protein